MLFLHGGAYVAGTADAYRGFVSQIAALKRTQYAQSKPSESDPQSRLPITASNNL